MSEQMSNNPDYIAHHPDAIQNIRKAHYAADCANKYFDEVVELNEFINNFTAYDRAVYHQGGKVDLSVRRDIAKRALEMDDFTGIDHWGAPTMGRQFSGEAPELRVLRNRYGDFGKFRMRFQEVTDEERNQTMDIVIDKTAEDYDRMREGLQERLAEYERQLEQLEV